MKKLALIVLLLLFLFGCTPKEEISGEESVATGDNTIIGEIHDSEIKFNGMIKIEDVGEFDFDSKNIKTVREDIFKPGRFSVFDILVHLDERGEIEMDYHFDEDMNTNVIDSIGGKSGWWYMVYYDGGWPETNNFRMDHYPYKDKMYIRILKNEQSMVDKVHGLFKEEIKRKNANNGKIIVPEVILDTPDKRFTFQDVHVTAHNVRNDVFQEGVIVALDTVLSLADQGKISYGLKWYDSIGSAGIVRSYWLENINSVQAEGRCGFVYEAGSLSVQGFRGNHIHLPSDTRVLNSPEYVEYFWICI